jgi:hypothetical protein
MLSVENGKIKDQICQNERKKSKKIDGTTLEKSKVN